MKDLTSPPQTIALEPTLVKGREALVQAYKILAS